MARAVGRRSPEMVPLALGAEERRWPVVGGEARGASRQTSEVGAAAGCNVQIARLGGSVD